MNEYELICLTLEEVRKQTYNLQQMKDTLEWAVERRTDPKIEGATLCIKCAKPKRVRHATWYAGRNWHIKTMP